MVEIEEEDSPKVAFVCGGTFGHVSPALCFFKKLYTKSVLFVEKKCARFLEDNNFSKRNILFFQSFYGFKGFDLLINFLKSFVFFWKNLKNINLIFCFGAYPTVPAIICGFLFCKPVLIHEQNSVLGRVNFFALLLGINVLTSFKNTYVRDSFFSRVFSIFVPRGVFLNFGFPVEKINKVKKENNFILVLAGSGASDFFDDQVAPILAFWARKKNIKVFFQAKNQRKVQSIFMNTGAEVKTFFQDYTNLIENCSLILSRAGASTLSLILANKKKSIVFPLKNSKDNHQLKNCKGFNFLEEQDVDNLFELLDSIEKHEFQPKETNLSVFFT